MKAFLLLCSPRDERALSGILFICIIPHCKRDTFAFYSHSQVPLSPWGRDNVKYNYKWVGFPYKIISVPWPYSYSKESPLPSIPSYKPSKLPILLISLLPDRKKVNGKCQVDRKDVLSSLTVAFPLFFMLTNLYVFSPI